MLLLTGCANDTVPAVPSEKPEEDLGTIAIILPMSNANGAHWKRTAEWAMTNFNDAQNSDTVLYRPTVEWYDEDEVDIDSLVRELADRDEVKAVIGPYSDSNILIAARAMYSARKLMVTPVCTSAEVDRMYASKGYFWSLSESNITQCEMLLNEARNRNARGVSLVAPCTTYGQTFVDWFGFQASEMGLNVKGMYLYSETGEQLNTQQLSEKAANAIAEARHNLETDDYDVIIAIPENVDVANAMLKRISQMDKDVEEGKEVPGYAEYLFSDMAYSDGLLVSDKQDVEGFAPAADPLSGFSKAYEVCFGQMPSNGEPQLYDAIMLTSMALYAQHLGKASTPEAAFSNLVSSQLQDSERMQLTCWRSNMIHWVLSEMRNDVYYDLNGASGMLNFDVSMQSSVLSSVYVHWKHAGDRGLRPIEYVSANGGYRSSSLSQAWEWEAHEMQTFTDGGTTQERERTGNYAILVATSTTWENYRHQADVLNMYHMLLEQGYTDDHILLVMEDDIAYAKENPTPGSMKRYDGVELYANLFPSDGSGKNRIDGRPSEMTIEQFKQKVLDMGTGPGDDIFVFWSGHGARKSLCWGSHPSHEGMTYDRMADLLRKMYEGRKYRKMLWLVETCYSGSVGCAAEDITVTVDGKPQQGVPDVLFITAANANEPSKADCWDEALRTSLCDRFSRLLTEALRDNPNILYRELYTRLIRGTNGSHVSIFNPLNYDNLYSKGPKEFLGR